MFDVPAVDRASPVSPAQAAEIALAHYGVSAAAERLASEHDDTFRLAGADGVRRLLKISTAPPALAVPAGGGAASGGAAGGGAAGGGAAGGAGGAGGAGFQTAVLLHLARVAPELPVQRVVATLDGRPEVALDRPGREPRRVVRMTSWLDGQLLGRGTTSVELRREIGATLGRLNIALRGFVHPGAYRTHQWDLQNLGALRPLLEQLPESGMLPSVGHALAADGPGSDGAADGLRALAGGGLRAALADCLDHFDAVVRPALAGVPVQVIHTDFHGENLLTGGGRITGILDFGDALAGPVAMDVGVAACYQLGARGPGADPLAPALDADLLAPALEADLLAPALDVVAGYHAVDPLSDAELDLVAEFIVARVAARIIVSQANATREPANSGYLLRRTPQAVAHLAALRALPSDEIGRRLRAACHLEVVR
jgi:hydroxylysine kinase